ncbi:unnamed protein product [Linum tenue]|nr:unnamed protein product [Linum tenue]
MPKPFVDSHQWYLATVSSISSTARLVYSYSHVIDGFSAAMTPLELSYVQRSPGYLYSTKLRNGPIEYATTHSPEFLGLTGCSGAWEVSNYGEGMIIGLVDTGIWPESPSFSDHGMNPLPAARWKGECGFSNRSLCNNKLVGAQVFDKAGNVFNISTTKGKVISPRDNNPEGHGTKTSSIAAGNFVDGASYHGYAPGTARGVAPKAHVAMYVAVEDSDFIAAIDRAVGDGVDVLSISMGMDQPPLYEDPIALSTFAAAVEKNVFVALAAGNNGPSHQTLSNGIPWVLTVAAGTIDRQFQAVVELGNGVSVIGSSLYRGRQLSSVIQAPIIFLGDCLNIAEIRNKSKGKIVVCQEEEKKNFTEHKRFDNVLFSGAAGSLFIINRTITDREFAPTYEHPYPGVFIALEDGEIIKRYLNSSNAEPKTSRFGITKLNTKPAAGVAAFSSRGPSVRCPYVLKPDIMGPGSMILGATPFGPEFPQQFEIDYGTSFSCPHLAGVAAIIKRTHPDWSTAAVRSAMMTTADALDNTGQPIRDLANWSHTPATGLEMGAGQVNPTKALDPGLVYDLNTSDYVSLLCALNFTSKQIKALTRSSSAANRSNPSLDLNYPSFIAFFDRNYSTSSSSSSSSCPPDHQIVRFHRTLTNVGEGTACYRAVFTPLKGFSISVLPEELEFKEQGEKLSYDLLIERVDPVRDNETFLASGYIKWTEFDGGNHVVQSPIVATNINFNNSHV